MPNQRSTDLNILWSHLFIQQNYSLSKNFRVKSNFQILFFNRRPIFSKTAQN